MRILVNGDSREVRAADLSAALEELGYAGAVIATAVNGEFVAANERQAAQLAEGDELEVLAPMQGG
ncbi:MAG TPA: sulfur carrier protein ThiS [Steroidobacteraceae bacterium]|nr:sulfur carrier protein ThiS [Steroidobacteraceae bacterium]